jgi:hypothetical protein
MDESLKCNRIHFAKKGVQAEFIQHVEVAMCVPMKEIAGLLSVHPKTLSAWKSERFRMPYEKTRFLSQESGVKVPEKHTVILWKDHLRKISKQGGKSRLARYGKITLNEEARSEKWREWWEHTGKHKAPGKNFQTQIPVQKPKVSKRLAEFIGIMLGDGCVAPYQIKITLSSFERAYAEYICTLLYSLFSIKTAAQKVKGVNALNIIISRKELVVFCVSLGLVQGNKVLHQISVPQWIEKNPHYARSCVRGLIDTDGCFYTNSYVVNGKKYSYQKIAFTSKSIPLLKSVQRILQHNGIIATFGSDRKSVRVSDSSSVTRYMKLFGTSNKKHLQKYKRTTVHIRNKLPGAQIH